MSTRDGCTLCGACIANPNSPWCRRCSDELERRVNNVRAGNGVPHAVVMAPYLNNAST